MSASSNFIDLNQNINRTTLFQNENEEKSEYISMIPLMERKLMFMNEPLLLEHIKQYQTLDAYEVNQYLMNKQSKRNIHISELAFKIGKQKIERTEENLQNTPNNLKSNSPKEQLLNLNLQNGQYIEEKIKQFNLTTEDEDINNMSEQIESLNQDIQSLKYKSEELEKTVLLQVKDATAECENTFKKFSLLDEKDQKLNELFESLNSLQIEIKAKQNDNDKLMNSEISKIENKLEINKNLKEKLEEKNKIIVENNNKILALRLEIGKLNDELTKRRNEDTRKAASNKSIVIKAENEPLLSQLKILAFNNKELQTEVDKMNKNKSNISGKLDRSSKKLKDIIEKGKILMDFSEQYLESTQLLNKSENLIKLENQMKNTIEQYKMIINSPNNEMI